MPRRLAVIAALPILAAAALIAATPARAGVLDDVRQAGIVRCGGAIRPGLAFPDVDHSWQGLEVEMCRAVALAALGPAAKIDFQGYGTDVDFARARDGADQVSFLTGSEMFAHRLFGSVAAGPPVFYETTRIMVWAARPIQHVGDLGETMVCAEPGTGPERNLQAFVKRHGYAWRFSPWQELEEEMDAFGVGRCPAVANEETALAALQLASEAQDHPARILPEALGATPILATTPTRDPVWSAIVAWTVQTVISAERTPGVQGPSLPIAASAFGLDDGWQMRVRAAVGSYRDLFERTLGSESPLGLTPGLNARWDEGGLFAPPTID